MIPATVNPAAKDDFLIRQRFVQLAAIVGTHHVVVFLLKRSGSSRTDDRHQVRSGA
jgi:hypothetical protein